ncbi:MAG: hypothetical protein A3B89_01240 [Candidatus Buchananbacteria bacterium RIFCSPHIGHO2_02_FULL_40_13]|uniref:Uncharacterized protein n=1 Tax=Candidatus Buchananbacteria bacterium RIFCSPLOWO2_01_FULL_39_33 TaxID=1797543 RepID=A0A1G1YMS3_9BACT|nr:MAG: hypothetical protein A2820_03395 [Candidatus Buchananbacteria bacterium RIFCSPHIGHO2_01_FULL_40_35]OGY50114.1 MAG: hypothetical protein A3B89_01240 [Candidatus Buchananbacteria bacterium RIFCSPHIGHO2_02_FULL_40_13]OGY53096.1 MAG: hypothetical protein A3A02_00055 [Candidatus Buchananbacteria bacterium RIFCSPLOWO2_01_FULL_39_33]
MTVLIPTWIYLVVGFSIYPEKISDDDLLLFGIVIAIFQLMFGVAGVILMAIIRGYIIVRTYPK